MSSLEFTRDQARTMLLAAQGFGESPLSRVTAEDVDRCIIRMGVLQIDTIHVVARSPYFVLWSRLGDYEPKLLEDLHAEGKLFEYWSHEACFIPIGDYALYRRQMLEERRKPRVFDWLKVNREAAEAMLLHVRENGVTRSSDFERLDGKKGSWWDWKEEKVALDFLHTSGELMISRRDKFQRIYDLRQRVHPQWKDSDAPPYEEVFAELIAKSVKCLGAPLESWCADYFRLPKKDVSRQLDALAESGVLVQAKIEGYSRRAFVHRDHLELANAVIQGMSVKPTCLLSPFDPIVWDRARGLELFDFDYRIECYTPEPKRKYGYFVLPILLGNRIVGRLDAKAHRKDKTFEVKDLFIEDGIEVEEELVGDIALAIEKCAVWHQTPIVKVTHAAIPKLARRIQSVCKAIKTRSR